MIATRTIRKRVLRGEAFAVLLLMTALGAASVVRADEILSAQTYFFSGTDSQTVMVNAPGAGIVDVTLTDLAWPTRLTSLSFSLSTASSILQPMSGSPTSFAVSGAGALYAHVSGVAGSLNVAGLPNMGLFSLQVAFAPATTPVPLPPSLSLLLAGLCGLLGIGLLLRRSASSPLPALGR